MPMLHHIPTEGREVRIWRWIVVALLLLIAILIFADRGHAQSEGPPATVTNNCATNHNCLDVYIRGGGGGGGSGCIPPGGTGNLLYDNGSDACDDVTQFTYDGTSKITGASGTLDLTGMTLVTLRVHAGLTTSANGDVGYDSTNKIWHIWQNAADKYWIVSSNLGTSGQPCLSNANGSCTFADPIVSGATAIGAAPSTNPVFIGTWDGTDIQVPLTTNTTPGGSDYALEVRQVGLVSAASIGTATSGDLLIGTQVAGSSVPVALPTATITTLTPVTAAAIGTATSGDLLIGTQVAGSSVPVALPTATITTLTPPTAAAVGTSVSGDLLIGTQAAGSSVPVALPTATITTLTPPTAAAIGAAVPTAAAIGTAVSTDLLIGTQLAAASVPVALPTATITSLTPPTAAAIGTAVASDLTTITATQATGSNLHMVCDSGCSSSAGFADNSAFTVGTTAINPIGGLYDTGTDPSISNGNAGRARIDSHSYLLTDLATAIPAGTNVIGHVIADSGSTTAVTGVVEVAPTTSANTLSNHFFTQLSDGTHGQTFMSTTTSSKYGADTNILSILGTAPTTAGFLDVKGADGNVFVRQTTGSNLHVQADSGSTTVVTGVVEVAPTGSANTASNQFFDQPTDGTNTMLIDPCKSVAKVYTVINQAAAGPTTLVAGTSAKKTYICSIVILPVTAAISVNLVEGTGTNCSSVSAGVWGGMTAATGAVIAINGGFTFGNGDSAIAQTATNADNLCIIASGTTQISGGMYVVQR